MASVVCLTLSEGDADGGGMVIQHSQVVQLDHLKARECGFFYLGSITSTPGHYRNTASNCFDHELTIYRIAFFIFYRFYALQTYSLG